MDNISAIINFRRKVNEELKRQDKLWGKQKHSDYIWLAILLEEVGEVSKAILENENILTELVQCCAVIENWIQDNPELQIIDINQDEKSYIQGPHGPRGRRGPIGIHGHEQISKKYEACSIYIKEILNDILKIRHRLEEINIENNLEIDFELEGYITDLQDSSSYLSDQIQELKEQEERKQENEDSNNGRNV